MPDSWPRLTPAHLGNTLWCAAMAAGREPSKEPGGLGGGGTEAEQHPSLPLSRLPGPVAWIRHWLGGLLSPFSREGHKNHWAERNLQGLKLRIRSPCSSLFPWAPLVCPGHLRSGLEGKGGVMARGLRKKWGPGGACQQDTWLPVPSPFTLKCPRLTL